MAKPRAKAAREEKVLTLILLRDIRPDELSSLSELCLRSKAVWGYDEDFMRACRNELTLRPDALQTSHLQVAERDSIAVGVAQIKIVGRDADLTRLFVEPALLGAGIGRLLFEWAAAKARNLGADGMTIEADPGAAPFYERMGARQVGFVPSQSIPGRALPLLRLELEKETGLPR
jgi:GNAT superfamily N-acetyltransferase